MFLFIPAQATFLFIFIKLIYSFMTWWIFEYIHIVRCDVVVVQCWPMSVSAAEYSTQYTLYCTVTVQHTELLALESTTAGQSINPPFCHNRHHGITAPTPAHTASTNHNIVIVLGDLFSQRKVYNISSNVCPQNSGSFACLERIT